ncbi:hypothetical protein HUU59_08820 [bacterium]|nr:hypothetical protein [bacterium]
MNGNIARLTALALILLTAISAAYAKRLLLPPPEGYKGVEINGVRFVVGQVYIPEYADTVKLKEYGFRAFEPMGSSHTYRKVKAIWPLDLNLKALPEWISGLTYEKAKSVEEMQQAYKTGPDEQKFESVGTLFNIYGNQYNNYGGWMVIQEPYKSPGDPNYRLNNYGFYNDGRRGNQTFNDWGIRYHTKSPTLLTPTNIGVYSAPRYYRPRYWR